MNKKKKMLLTALSVALVAIIAVFGTVAYLTDTDSDVNVMTVGNVQIELIEQQRDEYGTGLEEFEDGKLLMPIVGSAQGTKDQFGLPTANNYVDKIITVKNTGENDAWVRVLVGFPQGMDSDNASDMPLHWNGGDKFFAAGNKTDVDAKNSDYENWVAADTGKTAVQDGITYNVYSFTRKVVLPAGEETPSACVIGFYLDSRVNWDENGYFMMIGDQRNNVTGMTEDGYVYIPVMAQAIQAAGFATADAAFAASGLSVNPWDEQDIWDGDAPTEEDKDAVTPDKGDEESKTVTISSAAELAAFAAVVNGGEGYAGYTVELASDIDLNNMEWTPIGNVVSYPGITFAGTFDGKNHTISNLNAVDNTENYASSGLFGSITGVVKNVNLENVTVTSTHYAGAIVGFASANNGMKIENCHVNGGTITTTAEWIDEKWDNGDKAGGIIGYCDTGDVVTGCSVKNVTIKGYRDIGGIAGHAKGVAYITNNTVSNVTLIWDNSRNYKNYRSVAEADLNTIIGDTNGNTVDASNSGDAVIREVVSDGLITDQNGDYYVYNAAGLQSLKNWMDTNSNKGVVWGKTYNIMADIDATDVNWTTKFIVPDSATFAGFTFNGNGHTIKNLTINGQGLFTGTARGSQSNVPATFKNITFDNVTVTGGTHHNGVVWGEVYGSITLEKVSVVNSKVSGGCNVGGLVGRNSESHATIKFVDCSVKNTTVEATQVADYAGASAFLGMALHITGSTSANVIFEGTNVAEGNTLTTVAGMQGGGIYTIATWGGTTWNTPTVVNDFTNYNSNN